MNAVANTTSLDPQPLEHLSHEIVRASHYKGLCQGAALGLTVLPCGI